jgi:hypothetical protein
MSNTIPRVRWCDVIVLNVHAPAENKINDVKDRFYEELESVMNILTIYQIPVSK